VNPNPEPQPRSPLTQLAKALEQAPSYFARFTVGMISSVLSDVLMTALLIGAVCLAFQTTVLIAAAAFFIIYAILGVGSGIALSIGQGPVRRLTPATSSMMNSAVPPVPPGVTERDYYAESPSNVIDRSQSGTSVPSTNK